MHCRRLDHSIVKFSRYVGDFIVFVGVGRLRNRRDVVDGVLDVF